MKKRFISLLVILALNLSACAEADVDKTNVTEEEYLQYAYPGIYAEADIDGDGMKDSISIATGWREYDAQLHVDFGTDTSLDMGIQGYGAPYITVADINQDGKAEVLVGFKGTTGQNVSFQIYEYEGDAFVEVDIPAKIRSGCKEAYLVNDTSVLRVWFGKKGNAYQDYSINGNAWTAIGEKVKMLQEEKNTVLLTDLIETHTDEETKDKWMGEIKTDIDGNGEDDIIQVRDVSFTDNHSYSLIKTWLNESEVADYTYSDNFAFSSLMAEDLDRDGKNEIVVRQVALYSNEGVIVPSILTWEDGQWKEIPIDIDNVIDINIVSEEGAAFIRITSLADVESGDTEIYDVEFDGTEVRYLPK